MHEQKTEALAGGAGNVLKLTLHAAHQSMTVSGTARHGRFPRLLSCDGIDIEAPLEGTLLFLRNQDVPGVIGKIGTTLGDHNVNIANFALGRADGQDGNGVREGAGRDPHGCRDYAGSDAEGDGSFGQSEGDYKCPSGETDVS